MEKLFKIIPPKMPNFVRFEKEAQLKQDGFKVVEVLILQTLQKKKHLNLPNL